MRHSARILWRRVDLHTCSTLLAKSSRLRSKCRSMVHLSIFSFVIFTVPYLNFLFVLSLLFSTFSLLSSICFSSTFFSLPSLSLIPFLGNVSQLISVFVLSLGSLLPSLTFYYFILHICIVTFLVVFFCPCFVS